MSRQSEFIIDKSPCRDSKYKIIMSHGAITSNEPFKIPNNTNVIYFVKPDESMWMGRGEDSLEQKILKFYQLDKTIFTNNDKTKNRTIKFNDDFDDYEDDEYPKNHLEGELN
jgi:hypothetical protein